MAATSRQQTLGALLLLVGLVGMVIGAFDWVPTDPGSAVAVSMFLVIMGLVFYFPSLLQDDTGAASTMRVTVLMVVSLFVVLTLKVGWGAESLEDLTLSQEWIWVLAAAFGGKAAQSFSENAASANRPMSGKQASRKSAKDGNDDQGDEDH